MPVRKAQAVWNGNLREGKGSIAFGPFEGAYTFVSRFEEGEGTNPEELLAAAHAGCFSMALAHRLDQAGHTPRRVQTEARVHLEMTGDGPRVSKVELHTEVEAPGLDEQTFLEHAEAAKEGCPISKALASVPVIELHARLV
ncbi:OsmC family protein [Rhodothermus profundi]|uniref:Osmotically inducible protein OsmC n=1 Tax=Rhodothermus profundi TaxID=633813 RepID=A0A1M6SR25_9BACT|nr:OsmC family protein [Rhodothermus profundi]SHK47173.1 osmotically inducible protein OsmC [Rhodothermus profundi]